MKTTTARTPMVEAAAKRGTKNAKGVRVQRVDRRHGRKPSKAQQALNEKAAVRWWWAGWDRAWSKYGIAHALAECSLWPFGKRAKVRLNNLLRLRAKKRWLAVVARAEGRSTQVVSPIDGTELLAPEKKL